MTPTESPQPHWQLADWLAWQERLNPRSIELGLARTREVAVRLGLLPATPTTLTVAGTNGKGSSATLAAAIYRAAGYRVGCYTSPHLLRYNERVAVDGVAVSDDALCRAFAAIEAARAGIPLTYFEYGTLAALWLFHEANVQIQVLEVGLGGRLDAVNVVDADCALLTSVGIDHTDWLGPDRDSIGREKAGVFRRGRPAICADPSPPGSVLSTAADLGADLRCVDRDFRYAQEADRWRWQGRDSALADLPAPLVPGAVQLRNAAGVLAAVEALQVLRPVAPAAIVSALPYVHLPGRLQRHGDLLLDVGHNVEAVETLVAYLRLQPPASARRLVLGMLADKPVEAVGRLLAPWFERIYCAGLPGQRGLGGAALAERLATAGVPSTACEDVATALAAARSAPPSDAAIVVCGSFLTVAAALSMP